jgi:protocatechuate 3,4-dioxygenase beta subunit
VHEHNVYIDDSVPAMDVTVTLLEVVPLEGLLLDRQTGEPLANQDVIAHPFLATHGRGLARSDSDGRFVFEDLSPGRYNIWADPVGHSRGGTVVDVEGWNSEVELKLMRAGKLRGQVLSPDGAPVRSFDVQLLKHGTRQMPGSPVGRHQRIKGNGEGEFVFEDLEPGLYSVDAWAKGYAYTQTKQSMLKVRRGQEVSGYTVTMQRGAGLVGQVVDDLGQPISGARVSLHNDNMSEVDFIRSSDVQPQWMAKTHTDRDGWYQLEDITARSYQLQVDHSSHPVVRMNGVRAEAGVLLELSAIELPRSCTLQGVAVDGSGAPQIEATIWVTGAEMPTRQVRTDGKGRYVMRRLPPGSYQVVGAPSKPKLGDLQSIFQAEMSRALAQHSGQQQLVDLSPGQTYEHTVVVDA